MLAGNINLQAYQFSIPLSFAVSNRNSTFSQPFNQLGMSPKIKWATFHLGYRNLKFSPYVLDGHKILGVGLELNPGKFRFAAVQGRFKREINVARNIDETLFDSISQYSRKGYAVKLGVGNKKTFFDLTYLHALDDTLSLSEDKPTAITSPESNAVLGLNARVQLSKKIDYSLSSAFSAYTFDVSDRSQSIDELPQSIFLPPVNLSTRFSYVIKSTLNLKANEQFKMGLNYLRVNPNFASMGMYYVQDDVENITLSSSLTLLNKTLRASATIGTERNNLMRNRSVTSRRWVGSANMDYNPGKKFGLTVNYSNYSVNQNGAEVQIADSVKLYQANKQFSIIPRYMIYSEKANHVLMFMFNYSGLKDKNAITQEETEFNLRNIIFTYNAGFIQSGVGLTASLTRARVLMPFSESLNQNVLLGVSKSLFNNNLQLRFNQMVAFSKSETDKSVLLRPAVSGTLRIRKNHQIRCQLYLKKNISDTEAFTESVADFTYQYNFHVN